MEIIELEPPLPENLVDELTDFWEAIFETPYDGFRGILTGAEREHNYDGFYLVREGKQLVGTTHLTMSQANPALGGLGEVAVPPEFRRRGIARMLCKRARDVFCERGGQALFLGTGNPAAARVYHRLGWWKLAGANVMALITSGDSPEAFLVDDFRQPGPVTIAPGTAQDRIPMIPLLVSPHNWQVLDANVGMFSTRYAVQSSCMGLFPKYAALSPDGQGAWFSARTDGGRLVGLSTARLDSSGRAEVDGFVHQNASGAWTDLIGAAMRWAAEQGVTTFRALVSIEDEDKRSMFEGLGFRQIGVGEAFNLGERQIESVRLEKANAEHKR
ncbi:MAG: GNAT family N-acetyltransferase [Candidatus Poribacteria bacterium]|nr:GNAT family N-acetyltransferase [Candidatus Poribacteria bacterium]